MSEPAHGLPTGCPWVGFLSGKACRATHRPTLASPSHHHHHHNDSPFKLKKLKYSVLPFKLKKLSIKGDTMCA